MSDAERETWNARYRQQEWPARPPSHFLVSVAKLLPQSGRALDVAGGTGANALWLAQQGLDTTLVDISEVALDLACGEARARGVPLKTLALDLDSGLPDGPWDVIVCVNFLLRSLFEEFPRALGPEGLLVVEHPTMSNLLRHEKPGPRYLLNDRELPRLVDGLEVVRYTEDWTEQGYHEARLLARKGP